MSLRRACWLLLFLVGGLALPAAAVEIAGAQFAESASLESEALTLNGAGVRGNFLFSVYAIGLYLPHRCNSLAEVFATPGPKRIEMHTLMDIPADKFAKALEDGIINNLSAAEVAQLRPRMERLESLIRALKSSGKHALIQMEWHPKYGTYLYFNGVQQGQPVPGEDLYRALLSIWLGEHVHDEKLRDALFGKLHQA